MQSKVLHLSSSILILAFAFPLSVDSAFFASKRSTFHGSTLAFVSPTTATTRTAIRSNAGSRSANGHGLASQLIDTTSTEQRYPSPSKEKRAEAVHDVLSDLLWNANHIMDPHFWSSTTDVTLQSFRQTLLDSVKTQLSTIPGAGRGLFATRDIPAGTLVTLYPIHIMGINYFDGGSEWVAVSQDDQDYFLQAAEATNGSSPNYSLYLLGNRPPEADHEGTYVVDCNPHRENLPGWVAHRINDGAVVADHTEDGILDYLDASRQRQNAVICPWGPSPLVAAFATRDVKKGDEIFTSYGVSYWLDAGFKGDERLEKTEAVKDKERLLFKCYLDYATTMRYEKEAVALQNVFDSL